MNILFLGDIVGDSGCISVKENLPKIIKNNSIDFVVVNGENAATEGVGITENITNELLSSGVDVITTGNHVWDQNETFNFIANENRLLRPENLVKGSPGKGYGIFKAKNNKRVAVVNLMGNIFMKKCDDVFQEAKEIMQIIELKKDADFIYEYTYEEKSKPSALGNFIWVTTLFIIPTMEKRDYGISLKIKDKNDNVIQDLGSTHFSHNVYISALFIPSQIISKRNLARDHPQE